MGEDTDLITFTDQTDVLKGQHVRSSEMATEIMIATTSHDLRTPLNTMINMQDLLEPFVTDPAAKKFLKVS